MTSRRQALTRMGSLAQRSAQAAKEIKDLIGASVGQVENGTKLVDQAGATISALVGDVKRVSGLMRSIAEASAEQSRGVLQVNKTVTEMMSAMRLAPSLISLMVATTRATSRPPCSARFEALSATGQVLLP